MTITSKTMELGEMDDVEKRNGGMKDIPASEVDQFAICFFLKKCEQFHEDPKAFAAFLLNINGELVLASFACSPIEDTDRKKLASKKTKNQIMHKNPLVLARRGLIRYFIREIKQMETSGMSKILERNEEGELQLKKTCQVYMYSTYSHICEYVYFATEAIKSHDTNHCIMNKIRRWVMLGVQGALLSNILAPVYISKIIYGSSPPLPTIEVHRLLFEKMVLKDRELPRLIAMERESPTVSLDRTFVWYQGLNGLDVIGENGKLEQEGIGSSICKEEIFKAYLQLGMVNKTILKYSRAKKRAGHYQALKKIMYKKWESENNGKWLRRNSNKVDKFWVQR